MQSVTTIVKSMNRELLSLLAVCGMQLAYGCAGSQSTGDPPSTATDPKCQLNSKSEQTPGFPFNVATFTSTILPAAKTSCGAAGCHASPSGNGGLVIWADAATGNCDFAQTFNSITALIDPSNPGNSQLTAAVTGGDAAHPVKLTTGDATLLALTAFATDAATTLAAAGGGGSSAPPTASPFDYAVFQSTVEPALDAANCSRTGCHGGAGQNGFALKAAPAANSADMQANFTVVTARGELTGDPATGIFYVQATTSHAGGGSSQISATAKAAVLKWLTDAKTAAGGAGNGANSCPPIAGFNQGVFTSEILPILAGTLDLNQAGGAGSGGGCMKTACHGTNRGSGTLALVPGTDPATLLQNFACFVNVTTPQASEILLCPENQAGCRKQPHPGDAFFNGAGDLNYQRLLSFIYGSKLNVSPLDYAFFVRQINPIFNDVNAVENGALNLTCADTVQCHGVGGAGQLPPNGSDFGIIGNVADDANLTTNFVAATGFANFLLPSESSLFLYPTNEIADKANHILATGIDHPGGPDFPDNSVLAQTILTWVAGLRPDGQGFVRNWLVNGDFAVNQLTDQTAINEATVTPRIFDPGGGQFNLGQWDGFFSASANVDLNIPFPNSGVDRVAYASAYVINSQANRDVNIVIGTNNPVQVYIDGALRAQNNASGGTTAFATLQTNKPVHILIKLQQRENDAAFAFTAQTTDNQGALLTDKVGGLIFTLAPNGGL